MKPNTFFRTLCGLSLMLTGTVALADDANFIEKPYIGLDYSAFSYKNTGSSSNANESAARFRAGSTILPWLGVEVQAATGLAKGSLNASGVNYNVSLDTVAGIFVRPQLTYGPVTVYGLGGYSYSKLQFSSSNSPIGNTSRQNTGTGASFGAGAEVTLDKQFGVSADYTHYISGLSAASLGVVYHWDE